MTPDQRLKLAQALFKEAVICSERNDIEEARHLSELAVKHEFKDEIERIIKGDVEVFKMVIKNQYSKNAKVNIISRIMLNMLLNNEDFKKTFRKKYVHLYFEMEGY
tara:strand:+ start:871 stop:1188 length:318 start_codon:yes stop_codon:yes gene_type:complete